ncbi:hypothetical protein [Burkholderia sp. 3C]
MSTSDQPSISLVSAPRIGWTVALSLVFYLIALSAGLRYNPTHAFWHSSETEAPATSDGEPIIGTVSATPPILVGDAPAGLLLTQALDCAQARQWECMGRASEAARALQGDAALAQVSATPPVMSTAAAATLAAAPAVALAAARPHAAARAAVRGWKVSTRLHAAPRRPIQRVAYRVPARPPAPDPFFANLYRH